MTLNVLEYCDLINFQILLTYSLVIENISLHPLLLYYIYFLYMSILYLYYMLISYINRNIVTHTNRAL